MFIFEWLCDCRYSYVSEFLFICFARVYVVFYKQKNKHQFSSDEQGLTVLFHSSALKEYLLSEGVHFSNSQTFLI